MLTALPQRHGGSSFVGRDQALAELDALLRRARLVTLTGPGGVGKTRLALEAAARAAASFAGGVVFVDLAAVRDGALVLKQIAVACGLRDGPAGQAFEQLVAALREKPMLLVLDTFEQLVAAAPTLGDLLAETAQLTILVTSRAALRIAGEHELPVPPLSLAEAHGRPGAAEVLASATGRLFVDRARSVRPDFTLTDESAPAVAAICRRLDGLPLAIELAAARVRALPPTALLARLERRLPLLSGGPRDAPDRHRTLRDTIAWSYALLSPPAQRLFRRLALFVGGAGLAALEQLDAAEAADPTGTLDALTELSDQQLIRPAEDNGEEPRFAMLQVIREYAGELLAEHGEEATLRAWHCRHFLAIAEATGPMLTGSDQALWLARLSADYDNVSAALAHARAQSDAAALLRAGEALWRFWWLRGLMNEGRELLAWALAAAPPDEPELRRARAGGLLAAGILAFFQGDHVAAEPPLVASLALFEAVGDQSGAATAHNSLGLVALEREDFPTALAAFEQCLALRRSIGEIGMTAQPLNNLGALALRQGDRRAARQHFESAAQVYRSARNANGLAKVLLHLACVYIPEGEHGRARGTLREALALGEQLGARALQIEAVEVTARLAASDGQGPRGVRLFAAAEGLRARYATPQSSTDLTVAAEHVRQLRQELGAARLAEEWRAGLGLELPQAIELAQDALTGEAPAVPAEPAPPAPRPARPVQAPLLTERELEVLALLVEGHPNKAIAERLFVSPYTVHAHLRAIYGKLDVRTRSAAVRYAVEQRLLAERER